MSHGTLPQSTVCGVIVLRANGAAPLPRRDYLTRIWDLALAAREACQH